MEQCKSATCESGSLRNSEYCFEHYKSSDPRSGSTALALRAKDLKARHLKGRHRASRLSGGRTSDMISGIALGSMSAWAYGRSAQLAARKDGDAKLGDGAHEPVNSMLTMGLIAMVASFMRNEGPDGK